MYMRATVAAAVVAAASAFAPAPAALNGQVRLRSATCDVSMQMDRRAAAGLIFAAPAAAFASAGDSPKQSYFGAAPLSAPFGETYTNRGSNALWTELGDTEREIFTRIARKTKEELEAVVGYIGKSDWARARTALRLYTYETRKSMTRLSDAKSVDPEAKKLFSKFKRTIEACDLALEKKDGAKADALLQSATSIYNSWLEVVGVAV